MIMFRWVLWRQIGPCGVQSENWALWSNCLGPNLPRTVEMLLLMIIVWVLSSDALRVLWCCCWLWWRWYFGCQLVMLWGRDPLQHRHLCQIHFQLSWTPNSQNTMNTKTMMSWTPNSQNTMNTKKATMTMKLRVIFDCQEQTLFRSNRTKHCSCSSDKLFFPGKRKGKGGKKGSALVRMILKTTLENW